MYKESGYWDSRYERERELPAAGGHEWFGLYPDFAPLVRRQLRPGLRGLVLGCGTSSLSSYLYKEGVSPIISIDYSPICIKEMTERNAGIPEMSWMVMDARKLQFPDGSFDLVIEKGTLDSMMVDEKDPWNITPATVSLVDEVLNEVSRVLAPSGCFISITFSPPHFRTRHYAQPKYGWSVSCDTYGRDFHYFLYTMLKGGKLTHRDIERGQSLHKPRVIPDAMPTISEYEDEDFLREIQL
ncbi:PREDICTED: endothelin-converting enzyme 2-like [Nanorana parkeri]|uniref:endothelin-converting enzyme 2-like n=1 Tax=Nanorana parkeri TaxID=125878 RepID=UPI000854DF7F|nr:PREDICTED: endothelin-converting enzyme 2-like [Nanorana parkeri]